MFELKSKAVIFPLPVLILVAVALLAAPGTAKPNEKQISLRTTLLETEFLREDISNPVYIQLIIYLIHCLSFVEITF
jgi:hypothetical protein